MEIEKMNKDKNINIKFVFFPLMIYIVISLCTETMIEIWGLIV